MGATQAAETLFSERAGEDGEIDADELKVILNTTFLNTTFKKGKVKVTLMFPCQACFNLLYNIILIHYFQTLLLMASQQTPVEVWWLCMM